MASDSWNITNEETTQASQGEPPLSNLLFDSFFYLKQNADVRAAIASGAIKSAWDHFVNFGQYENRNTSALFDPTFYLEQNLDVRAAIASGAIKSAWDHFVNFGQYENRNASALFDPTFYLEQNLDVKAAVENNIFTSAWHHFVSFGQYEDRAPSTLFDPTFYLEQNPDVKAAVENNIFTSAWHHFVSFGQYEDRAPSTLFDPTFYLEQNPDVKAAVENGEIGSALDHFVIFGFEENRLGAQPRNPIEVIAPTANLSSDDITINLTNTFTVTYTDNVAIDVASIDGSDIRVVGPNGFEQLATLVSVDAEDNDSSARATYQFMTPGGIWDAADSGIYSFSVQPGQVADINGNFVQPAGLAAIAIDNGPINGTPANNTLNGNIFNNIINGLAGDDILNGNKGDDLLDGGAGSDTFDGGDGIDTVSYALSTSGISANLRQGTATTILRIMPLGDSITHGMPTSNPLAYPGAYRIPLWRKFQADSILIDFVGSQKNGGKSENSDSPTGFDQDHEGYPGKKINEIATTTQVNLNPRLQELKPNVILLTIGTNDAMSNRSVNQMKSDLSNLIDQITTQQPNAQLFVATIPPINPERSSTAAEKAIAFNRDLPSLISAKAAAGKNVLFVDTVKGVDGRSGTSDDLKLSDIVADGLHPNEGGYNKTANTWYEALSDNITIDRDTFKSVENLLGSDFDDVLVGSSGANVLNGGAGNDKILGGGGNDTFIGGAGSDVYGVGTNGKPIILDFQNDQDLLGLTNGLQFSQLTIAQGLGDNANHTLISLTSNGQLLASLMGVQATNITTNDFTTA
ncbi:GDSL-type esterase/lipase family protein [Trichocoleus desertorum AS-A10]|uniref:GDSL-type esterase/lipase family protein n=1 Tax=Trichocoleus desertorum TaxID=1481672 RepID=UPI003296DFA1